jgi:hypothetical protein
VSEATASGDPAAPAEPIHPLPPTPVQPKTRKKPHSDLPGRLLTAAVLIPLVLYVVVRGGLVFLATVVVIILLGQREFYRLIEDKGARPLRAFGLSAGAARRRSRRPWRASRGPSSASSTSAG